MSDETRNILFKLQLDVDLLKKNGVDAENQIKKLRDQQQGLNKDSLEYKTIAANIKTYQQQLKASADALAINNRLQASGVQGILQTRDALKAATTELYAQEQAYGASSEQANKARANVNQLTTSLMGQTEGIQKHYLSIGNYEKGVITLSKGLGGVVGLLGLMGEAMGIDEKTMKSFTEAHQVLTHVAKDLHHATELQTEQTVEQTAAQQGATVVTEEATVAQTELNTAMELSPVAILVGALAAVVALGSAIAIYIAYNKENTKFQDDMNTSLDGTKFSTRELADEYDKHILVLKEVENEYKVWKGVMTETEAAMSNLKNKNAQELEEIKKETETKLHEAGGFWADFSNGILNAFSSGMLGTERAFAKNLEITTAQNEKLKIKQAEQETEKNKLLLDAEIKYRTELAKVKVDAIKDAQTREIAQVKLDYEEKIKNAGIGTDLSIALEEEQNRKIADIKKKHADEAVKKKKEADAAIQKTTEEARKEANRIVDEEIKYEIDAIKNKDIEEQKIAIQEINDKIRNNKFVTTQELEALTEYNKKVLDAEKKAAADKLKLENDVNVFTAKNKGNQFKQELAVLDAQEKELLSREGLTEDQITAIKKAAAEKRKAITVAEYEMVAGTAANAFGQLSQLFKKNSVEQKTFAIAEIAMNEARAIAAAIAAAAANPYNAPTAGAAMAIQLALTIPEILAGIVQAKNILTSPTVAEFGAVIPLAEKGMILGGRSHSEGGVEISADGQPIAIAERGELLTIVNKKSTAMLNGLSNLNSFNGNGVSFMEKGGAIPMFQAGGNMALSNISQSVASKYEGFNMMIKYMKKLPPPVVGVKDIISAIDTQLTIKDGATI